MTAATQHRPVVYRARFVVPVTSPPIENAFVSIQDGRVVSFGKWLPSSDQTSNHDLGDVAILPAPINAHTHLEFSDLKSPLGKPGTGFVDWIRGVLEHRTNQQPPKADSAVSIAAGLKESHKACTSLIGEIATHREITSTNGRGVRFLELIGSGDERVIQQAAMAEQYLSNDNEAASQWKKGLSPHAPYTVSMSLLDSAVALSNRYQAPLAMHLAETREELQLLRDQTGPFRDLLEERSVWNPTAFSPNTDVIEHLQRLASAHRALVIHGNYLSERHWEFLSQHQSKMTLVFCPRTHAYFKHDEYALVELLHRGVRVALGTDSRASNPDLSLWAEFQNVAERFPQIDPADVLRMATINGAIALGDDSGAGSICKGAPADLVIAECNSASLYESLAQNDLHWLDGQGNQERPVKR